MSDLKGKVAIVTGASKGIGAGIAKALAKAGASVVVNYASSQDGADRVVAEITNAGGRAVSVQGDVSRQADVVRLFDETIKAFGAPAILVNNAGVFAFQPIEDVTEEIFHHHYNSNVLGTLLTIQQAIKHFPAEGGSIINVSSVAGLNPAVNSAVYSSTKAAVDCITVALSRELGSRNIRVNAVLPGHTITEGTTALGIEQTRFASETPIGARFGRPEDIAKTVLFLASDDSSWLTGERICSSGGWR
ncbi:SDR family NAD(P)-dependent oxidoreductase [Pseudomonas sp. NA-150]|uniref:SDR family NAD(P)-dependent oxidoreductase n=1 Tax=Pseudomonas sp. NA-150 TaxID=3367525 RepID=UPI0037C765B9